MCCCQYYERSDTVLEMCGDGQDEDITFIDAEENSPASSGSVEEEVEQGAGQGAGQGATRQIVIKLNNEIQLTSVLLEKVGSPEEEEGRPHLADNYDEISDTRWGFQFNIIMVYILMP